MKFSSVVMHDAHPAGTACQMAPETELLLRLAALPEGGAPREQGDVDQNRPIDWEKFLRLAVCHRIVARIYAALEQSGLKQVPPEVFAELRQWSRQNAAVALHLAGELLHLMHQFERAGIPVVPFKGLALAASVYGELSARQVGDLDLLVHRCDITRAVDLLTSMGHRPFFPTSTQREAAYLSRLAGPRRDAYLRWHCEHHLVRDDAGVNVDLHWAIALREFSLPLDTMPMWGRLAETQLAGRTIRTFSAEDHLLVLCVNGAKDCWCRLDRVCDIATLLRRRGATLDWEQILADARRGGAVRILFLGLQLASDLLGAPLPSAVESAIARDAAVETLEQRVCRRLLHDEFPSASRPSQASFQLLVRERWSDRGRYLLAHLRPGVGDWAALPLPAGLWFLYYFTRPFRLAARYGLDRLLCRSRVRRASSPASGTGYQPVSARASRPLRSNMWKHQFAPRRH